MVRPTLGRPHREFPTNELISLIEKYGVRGAARRAGISRSGVQHRLKVWRKQGVFVHSPMEGNSVAGYRPTEFPWRASLSVDNGIVLICGDAHYWPGKPSLMHQALLEFCREYKKELAAIIHIGDVIDAGTISRHQRIGWEKLPELHEEIEAAKDRLHEIEKAVGRKRKIWCLGNHDGRFEARIANIAPEYAKVHGVHLHDHFPLWETAWSCWINMGELVAKHRFKSGLYAPRNNTLYAGKSMATGHLHSAKVMPITDYNGTRWGIDVGCIADPNGQQFVNYTEDNPKDWREAFGYFTFNKSRLMQPELVLKWDKHKVQFRGKIHGV